MNTLILKKNHVLSTSIVVLLALIFLLVIAIHTDGFTTIPWGTDERLKSSIGSLFLPLVVCLCVYALYKAFILPKEIAVNVTDGNITVDGLPASSDTRLTLTINENQNLSVGLYSDKHTIYNATVYSIVNKELSSIENINIGNFKVQRREIE